MCSKSWIVNGTARNVQILDFTIPLVDIALKSDIDENNETIYEFSMNGEIQFEGMKATLKLLYKSLNSTYFVVITVNDTQDNLEIYASIGYWHKEGGVNIADGLGTITIPNFADDGSEFNVNMEIVYCNKPGEVGAEDIQYIWLFNGSYEGSLGLHNHNLGSIDLLVYKPLNGSWSGNLSAMVHLDNFDLDVAADIRLIGSTVDLFYVAVDYHPEQANVQFGGHILIPSKQKCDSGILSTGEGYAHVYNIDVIGNFTADFSWQVACNGSGYFSVQLKVNASHIKGFTIEDRAFSLDKLEVDVTRYVKGGSIKCVLVADLCGLENLNARAEIDLAPFTNFTLEVHYSDPSVYQSTDQSLSVTKPGDILAVLGRNSTEHVQDASDLSYTNHIGPAPGLGSNTYYDMFSHAEIKAVDMVISNNPVRFYADVQVEIYGATVILAISLEKLDTWGFAAGLQLDLENMDDSVPSLLRKLKVDLDVEFVMFTITNRGGTYNMHGRQVAVIPNSLTVYAEIDAGHSEVQRTKANSGDAGGKMAEGGVLQAMAEFSPSEFLLLITLSNGLSLGKSVTIDDLWLSLTLSISTPKVEIGFVGQATILLGYDHSTMQDETVTLLLQISVFIEPGAAGFGIFIAVCKDTDWQIATNIYLEFPLKFKFDMGILPPPPKPLAIGFAGGFKLGTENDPVLDAYGQVFLDIEEPSKNSFLLRMGKFDFKKFLTFVVGNEIANSLPHWLSDLITFDSLKVSYNFNSPNPLEAPPPAVASNRSIPEPSTALTKKGCGNPMDMLSFTGPSYGVIVDIENLNIGDGFIIFDTIKLEIVPKSHVMANITMEPFKTVPGVTITDYSGNSGPHFFLDAGTNRPLAVYISGGVNILDIWKLKVNFTMDGTWANGSVVEVLGDAGFVEFDLSVDYKNPKNGLLVHFEARNLSRGILDIMEDSIYTLFAAFNKTIEDAIEAVDVAKESVAEANATLNRAKQQVDQQLDSKIRDVSRCQGKVDGTKKSCHHYEKNCHWYKPWICVKEAECWIEYGVEWVALKAAEELLEVAKAIVDGTFTLLEGALSLAEKSLDLAKKVLQDLQTLTNKLWDFTQRLLEGILKVLDIRTLSATFIYGPKPEFDFYSDIEFFGDTYIIQFQCKLGWPEIGECIKPILLDLLNSALSKAQGSGNKMGALPASVAACGLSGLDLTSTSAVVEPGTYISAYSLACLLTMPNIDHITTKDTFYENGFPIIYSDSDATYLELRNSNLTGSFSFERFPKLRWLDLANNKVTGNISTLLNNQLLEYLDLFGTNISPDVSKTITNLPNLRYYSLPENRNSGPSYEDLDPVDFSEVTALRFLLHADLGDDSLCSECAPVVRYSGRCHEMKCANNESHSSFLSAIAHHLQNYALGHIAVADNLRVIQTLHRHDNSTMLLLEYSNGTVPFDKIYAALDAIHKMDQDISLEDVFPACPPGLTGKACNYFCRTTWSRTAPTDGRGGYVAPVYLGIKDESAFLHARPRCQAPINCGTVCTGAVMRAQYICNEFIETYTQVSRDACDMAIRRAERYCAPDLQERCVSPITNGYKLIFTDISNAGIPDPNANQVLMESHLRVPHPITDENRNLMLAVLAQATGGRAQQYGVTVEGNYALVYYKIIVDKKACGNNANKPQQCKVWETLTNMFSENTFYNLYRLNVTVVGDPVYFPKSIALGMPTSQASQYDTVFNYGPYRAVDGSLDTFQHTLNDQKWTINFNAVRDVYRVVAYYRQDGCCIERFDNMDFEFYASNGTIVKTVQKRERTAASYTFYFSPPVAAASMQVVGYNMLSFSEVQIHADVRACSLVACKAPAICPMVPHSFPMCECPDPRMEYSGPVTGCIRRPPRIDTITPAPTGGGIITIQGYNFYGGSQLIVYVDGRICTSPIASQYAANGIDRITCIAPESALPGRTGLSAYVFVNSMNSPLSTAFSYQPPTITFSPRWVRTGQRVDFCGTNLGAYATAVTVELRKTGTSPLACTELEITKPHTCMRCKLTGSGGGYNQLYLTYPTIPTFVLAINIDFMADNPFLIAAYGRPQAISGNAGTMINTYSKIRDINSNTLSYFTINPTTFGVNPSPNTDRWLFLLWQVNSDYHGQLGTWSCSMMKEGEFGSTQLPYQSIGEISVGPGNSHRISKAFFGYQTPSNSYFFEVTNLMQNEYNSKPSTYSFVVTRSKFPGASTTPQTQSLIIFYNDATVDAQQESGSMTIYK